MYAYFTPNNYTVYFNANGGNTPNPTSKVVTFDSTYGTLASISRTGYTFNGWYTAASGGTQVTDSTKVSITSDQTLYAHWKANTYTLTINANGGTCTPSSISGTYGSTWNTSGVTCTKSGYTFTGLTGVPSSVTGNATATAGWKAQQVSFAVDSWETIAKAVKSGNYIYKVGDTKIVSMGIFGTHVLRVANTTPCTNRETSETSCGFVIEFADIIADYEMNSLDVNVGGWKDSTMRTYVNNNIYNALPSDLREVIANTVVVSGHGSHDRANFITTDKLYLLNAQEVWGTNSYDTSLGTSRQLDYYANLGVTTDNNDETIKQYNGSNYSWWLRSAIYDTYYSFLIVYDLGLCTHDHANNTNGISPAFRIT